MQKTLFSWVVTGRLQQTATTELSTCLTLNESSIDSNLKRLWELEAVDSPHLQKPEHSICEEQYRMSVRASTASVGLLSNNCPLPG